MSPSKRPFSRRALLLPAIVAVVLVGCKENSGEGGGAEKSAAPPAAQAQFVRVGEVAEAETAFREFLRLARASEFDSERGKAIRTDEASSWKNPPKTAPEPVFDKIIRIDDTNAVARVTITVKWRSINLYYYLQKTDAWRVRCARALALTGMLEKMVEEYDADPSSVDNLPESAPAGSDDPTLTRSGARRSIENARFTLQSDQKLIEWFHAHRPQLEELHREANLARDRGSERLSDVPVIKKLLETLNVTAASHEENRFEVVIGGLVDNSVGFLWCDRASVPPITDHEYIWVEEIDGGWFLFRTT